MTVRVLGPSDLAVARRVIDTDGVVNVFADSLIEASRLEPRRGAEVWAYTEAGEVAALCHAGGNLVPVCAGPVAIERFTRYAQRRGRRCFQIVGEAAMVLSMWAGLQDGWAPAREVRPEQPFLVIDQNPSIDGLEQVRAVQPVELDMLYPAAVAMYREEVGIDPQAGPDGNFYRSRVAELIRQRRAYAWIEDGRVIFKAEIGAVGRTACQLQGVWIAPELRGRGIAAPAMASVVRYARTVRPVVTLYVNAHNAAARTAYARTGFREFTTFATVLF